MRIATSVNHRPLKTEESAAATSANFWKAYQKQIQHDHPAVDNLRSPEMMQSVVSAAQVETDRSWHLTQESVQ